MKYKHGVVFYSNIKTNGIFPSIPLTGSRTFYSNIEKPTANDVKLRFPKLADLKNEQICIFYTESKLDGSDYVVE